MRKMPWDIRDYVDRDLGGSTPEDTHPEIHRLYDCINTMVFLTDGIPYGVLYGEMGRWIDDIVQRINNHWPEVLPGAPMPPVGARTVWPTEFQTFLLTGFQAIQQEVNGASCAILFYRFWTERVVPSTVEANILNRFASMANHSTYGYRLCLPFLAIQQNARFVDDVHMDAHKGNMRTWCIKDIYTRAKKHNGDLAAAIGFGVEKGILAAFGADTTSKQDSSVSILGAGGNNYRKCGTGGCVTSATPSWCSVDAYGNCTSGSG